MAQKNVQINSELFIDLIRYFLREEDEEELSNLERRIMTSLQMKYDSIVARQMYSEYKKAPQGAERERLRQRYLDFIGVHEDFRTSSEWHPAEPPEAP